MKNPDETPIKPNADHNQLEHFQRQLQEGQLSQGLLSQAPQDQKPQQIPDVVISVSIPYNLDEELSLMAAITNLTELFDGLSPEALGRVALWYLDRQSNE